jgi:hypothetical protein
MRRRIRALIHRQYVFPGGCQLGLVLRGNRPILLSVRLPLVFFSVWRTVSGETGPTYWSSTHWSASRRKVHGARPAGGGLQAKAIRCASVLPSSLHTYWRVEDLSRKAASRPSSTKRWRTRATVASCTSSASRIAWSLQAGAAGPLSAFRRMRADSRVRAAALPRRSICKRWACSSGVNRTIYFFTAGYRQIERPHGPSPASLPYAALLSI